MGQTSSLKGRQCICSQETHTKISATSRAHGHRDRHCYEAGRPWATVFPERPTLHAATQLQHPSSVGSPAVAFCPPLHVAAGPAGDHWDAAQAGVGVASLHEVPGTLLAKDLAVRPSGVAEAPRDEGIARCAQVLLADVPDGGIRTVPSLPAVCQLRARRAEALSRALRVLRDTAPVGPQAAPQSQTRPSACFS